MQQQQEQTAESDKLSICVVNNTRIYKGTNEETVKISRNTTSKKMKEVLDGGEKQKST